MIRTNLADLGQALVLPLLFSGISWAWDWLAVPYPMAYIPLSSRGSDTDNHDGGIGQNLLQVLIVLALIQAVSQLLERKVEREDLWELRKVLEALLL